MCKKSKKMVGGVLLCIGFLPYDVQKLFEQKWKAIAGKNGKEGIRYPFSTYYKNRTP